MPSNSDSYQLPSKVRNSYRTYKIASQVFLRWLITTYASLAEPSGSRGPNPNTPRKKTSGKKKRFNAKAPMARSQAQNSRFNPRIPLALQVQYAIEIVAAGRTAPRDILLGLKEAIKLRKTSAAFYSSDADSWKDNRGHRYAIEKYLEVFLILGGAELDKEIEVKGSLLTGASNVAEILENMADDGGSGQDLQENEWIRDNPLLNQGSKKKKSETYPLEAYGFTDDRYENSGADEERTDAETRASELLYAIQWFFYDVNTLRKHCCKLWSRAEPVGTESRITAAYVTNQAAEMIKQLEADLMQDFPELKTTDEIYDFLRDQMGNLDYEMRVFFEYQIMGIIHLRLGDFGRIIKPGHVPLTKDGYFGFYNPHGDRTKMTTDERNAEDMRVVMNYLPELFAILTLLPKYGDSLVRRPHLWVGSDVLGPEFKKFKDGCSHPISMSLVFCVQMILEVLYIRRAAGVTDDLAKMRQLHSLMLREQSAFLGKNDINFDSNMAGFLQVLKQRGETLDFQLGPDDQLYRYKVIDGWKDIAPETVQPDTHWLMNPWMCANATAYAVLDSWDLSTQLVLGAGFVQCAMHLWNFLAQTGHLDLGSDSEILINHLIRVFGDAVFNGKIPKSYFGVRFIAMLSGGAGNGITASESEMFRLHTNPAGGLDTEQIRRLKQSVKSRGTIKPLNQPDYPDILEPLVLTKDLVDRDLQDRVTLNLWRVHLRYVDFFRKLWQAVKDDLSRVMDAPTSEMVEKESQLPFIVGYIIQSLDKGTLVVKKTAQVIRECGLDKAKVGEFRLQL